uniref:NAD(P)H dehydrogenase subunit CRR3, chloroplastic n=1 Tax=Davidia involucrata TaxID=16924 RepID=A0A5B7C245_DAVIN
MGCLSCISLTKTHIFASLPNNSPPQSNRKPPVRRINTATPPPPPPTIQQQKQPSIAEIERAIGAGIFRDRDTSNSDSEQKTLFDTIFSNSIGKTEGSVEKKLRETGEWIIDRSESASRSAGKKILKFVFLWILPMWIFSFLVASGLIRLPFSTPFLDDLIM